MHQYFSQRPFFQTRTHCWSPSRIPATPRRSLSSWARSPGSPVCCTPAPAVPDGGHGARWSCRPTWICAQWCRKSCAQSRIRRNKESSSSTTECSVGAKRLDNPLVLQFLEMSQRRMAKVIFPNDQNLPHVKSVLLHPRSMVRLAAFQKSGEVTRHSICAKVPVLFSELHAAIPFLQEGGILQGSH